ncbi:Exoenzyme regulatory protein AepA precursor [Sesbania bispinosa]|nr:Exoenzyme regulatory protein AepA precursor [Sesbania bispinosa]
MERIDGSALVLCDARCRRSDAHGTRCAAYGCHSQYSALQCSWSSLTLLCNAVLCATMLVVIALSRRLDEEYED